MALDNYLHLYISFVSPSIQISRKITLLIFVKSFNFLAWKVAIARGIWWWKSLIDIKQSCKCFVFTLWSIVKVRAHRCLAQGDRSKRRWSDKVGGELTMSPTAWGWGDTNVGIIGIEGAWDWEPRGKEKWGWGLYQAFHILPSPFLLSLFWFTWKLYLQWKALNVLLEIKISRIFFFFSPLRRG